MSVTNPDGGTVTRASAFTYQAPPTITSLAPTAGPTAGGTDVVITGTGFQAGASVRFGAALATVLQVSATSITVRTPAGAAGTVSVSVTNPDGGNCHARVRLYVPGAADGDQPGAHGRADDGGTDVVDHGNGLPDRCGRALWRDGRHGRAADGDFAHGADARWHGWYGCGERDQP